ncbi:hypothetical protein THAOC_27224, partial [Thalassiosira oceanica]
MPGRGRPRRPSSSAASTRRRSGASPGRSGRPPPGGRDGPAPGLDRVAAPLHDGPLEGVSAELAADGRPAVRTGREGVSDGEGLAADHDAERPGGRTGGPRGPK